MEWRSRVPPRARSAGRQLRAATSRARVRLRSQLHRSGPVPGLLSFIVPVYKVEDYLDECLTSLRCQQYTAIEIVCVDDGSPDRSVSIVRRHRLRDPRVRLVRRPNGGLSAARNTGVAAARGEFLAFVDSDDTVPPDGYRIAVQSLEATGSDFAVLPYQRLRGQVLVPAGPWIRTIHEEPRPAVDVDGYPDALANAIMCSKVFRSEFWHRVGLRFVEGIIYEDQQVSAEAYARARSFDVLTTPLYNWRIRNDRSSISQAKHEVANLRAQFAAANASIRVLERHASAEVVVERVVQLLSNDMAHFAEHIANATDDYWELLREELPLLLAAVPREEYLARVPPQQKVLQHLIVTDQRAAAEKFVLSGGCLARDVPSAAGEHGLLLMLPLWDDDSAEIPHECFRVAERQTRARTSIRAVSIVDGHRLEMRCWAFIDNVDMAGTDPEVAAWAVAPGRDPVPLEVTPGFDPMVDEAEGIASRMADYRSGAPTLVLDLDRLDAGRWSVEVEVAVHGLRRTAGLGRPWPLGSGLLAHAARAGARPAVVVAPRAERLRIDVLDAETVATSVARVGHALAVRGAGARPRLLALGRGRGPVGEPVATRADGDAWVAELPLPAPEGTWTLCAPGEDGDPAPVRLAPEVSLEVAAAADPGLELAVDPDGRMSVGVRAVGAVAETATFHDDRVEIALRVFGITTDDWTVAFRAPFGVSAGRLEPDGADRLRAVLPFREERWGSPGLLIRSGVYRVELEHRATGAVVAVRAAAPLMATLPDDRLVGEVRCRLQLRLGSRALTVHVLPPLPPDCRGPRNAARLQALANHGRGDEASVFFRTLYGEAANDTAAALHHELRRRGAPVRLYWSVADPSVTVPEGGIPLLEGTREWYERLGGAAHVVVNVHQPTWYRKPAGQVMVQTFHGYPYKGMGQDWWARSALPQARITSFLDRAEDWDVLVSPAPYATPHLLAAFFRPEAADRVRVLEAGYPRNDVLLDPVQGRRVRARTRRALGIADGETAVLYAPTFRDYLSADGMTAQEGDFLDVSAAAEALGPGYVMLVRGHAFHAREHVHRKVGQRVVDVTYYPDVTDLCLASDAAVLDYSSLRFDYALLRRPMVFLVPDEGEYHQNRPAIMPFAPTAPGPRVTTTAEVVRWLRDLPGLREGYADEVERFVATYLPLEDGHAAARVVDALLG